MRKILILAIFTIASTALYCQTKVIAHRGYWKTEGSAQNSLTAFKKAASIGVFASEVDVWFTGDNNLVANHDRIYKGVDIEKASTKEITKLELPNKVETIPTFEEYLKVVVANPNIRLVLEMKPLTDLKREDMAAEKAVKLLKKYDLVDRTDVISFSINFCLAFKKLLPDTKIYYLNGDLAPRSIAKLGLAGIDYSMRAYRSNPTWIKESKKLGLEVNVWTVNKEEDMRYFINEGVDYITTDEPELLQKLLK